jgi:hypothetical protein
MQFHLVRIRPAVVLENELLVVGFYYVPVGLAVVECSCQCYANKNEQQYCTHRSRC